VQALRKLEREIKREHVKVKISTLVLGETTMKALEKNAIEIIETLSDMRKVMGGRLELCSMKKFRNECLDFHIIVGRMLEADDWLRDHPTDTLTLTQAILDSEADIFYTTDNKLILSTSLKEAIKTIRKEKGFKELKIKPPP